MRAGPRPSNAKWYAKRRSTAGRSLPAASAATRDGAPSVASMKAAALSSTVRSSTAATAQ